MFEKKFVIIFNHLQQMNNGRAHIYIIENDFSLDFLSLPTPLNSQPCSWFYFNFKESVKKVIKKYFGHSIHKNEQKT